MLERSRAQELAAAIRDGERGGKARLEVVVDGEEPPEMLQVGALGRRGDVGAPPGLCHAVSSPHRCWAPSPACRRAAPRRTRWPIRARGRPSSTRQGAGHGLGVLWWSRGDGGCWQVRGT